MAGLNDAQVENLLKTYRQLNVELQKYKALQEGQEKNSPAWKQTQSSINAVKDSMYKLESEASKYNDTTKKLNTEFEVSRKQLAALTNEMANLLAQGKGNTQEFQDLAKRAGNMKDALDDARKVVQGMSSDFKGIDFAIGTVNTLSNAFVAYKGVAQLAGVSTDGLEKTMQKIIVVMTTMNAIQQLVTKLKERDRIVTIAQTAVQYLQTTATKIATAATVGFGAALKAALPIIGLVTAGIAAGVAIFKLFSGEAINAETIINNYKNALDKLNNSYNSFNSQIDQTIYKLKLKGADQKTIDDLEIASANTVIKKNEERFGSVENLNNLIIEQNNIITNTKKSTDEVNIAIARRDILEKALNQTVTAQNKILEINNKRKAEEAKKAEESARKAEELIKAEAERLKTIHKLNLEYNSLYRTLNTNFSDGTTILDGYNNTILELKNSLKEFIEIKNIKGVNADGLIEILSGLDYTNYEEYFKILKNNLNLDSITFNEFKNKLISIAITTKNLNKELDKNYKEFNENILSYHYETFDDMNYQNKKRYETELKNLNDYNEKYGLSNEEYLKLRNRIQNEYDINAYEIRLKLTGDEFKFIEKKRNEELLVSKNNFNEKIALEQIAYIDNIEIEKQRYKKHIDFIKKTVTSDEVKSKLIEDATSEHNKNIEKLEEDRKTNINNIKQNELEFNKKLEEEYYQSAINIAQQTFSIINELQNAQSQNRIDNIEREQRALEQQHKLGLYSEQEYTKKVIENQNKLDNEKRKLAQRQAISQKLQGIFNAGISTANAIMSTLAQFGVPAGVPLAAIAGAIGASQIAMIASQPLPKASKGGLLHGASHANGGIPIEAEGGEAIINKRSTSMFKPLLSAINEAGGGVKFANGGLIDNTVRKQVNSTNDIIAGIQNQPIYVSVEEIRRVDNRFVNIIENNQ